MIQTWPTSLPRPERPSWNLRRQEARRKSQADVGPPRYRRRISAIARGVSLSLILTRDQKAHFDRFYDIECKGGSELFWMPDPTTEGWPMLSAAGESLLTDGVPLLLSGRWLCAWGDETPAETIQGTEFRLAFSIWVLP